MFVTPKVGTQVPDIDRGGFLAPAGRDVAATPYWNRLVQVGDVVPSTPPVVVPPTGEALVSGDLLLGRRLGADMLFAPPSPGGSNSVGTFATLAALQAAFPAAANAGKSGLVGAAAPYAIYNCNGASWVDGGGNSGPLVAKDEGTTIASSTTSLNFTGAGVVATAAGGDVTVNIPGGGSSGPSYWFAGTFAGLQTATATDLALGTPTLNTGLNVSLVNDLGDGRGVDMRWDGSSWQLPRGYDLIKLANETVLAAGTTPQLVMPVKTIPAKLLATGARLECFDAIQKNASGTETMTYTVRLGTTGTIADQALYTLGSTTGPQIQARHALKVLNRTQLIHTTMGVLDNVSVQAASAESAFGGATTTIPLALTVGNLDADLILSYWMVMTGTVQIPRVMDARIRVS